MPPAGPSPSAPKRYPADRRRRVVDLPGTVGASSAPPTSGAVAFRVRHLEPLIAWTLAGYTLWVNILLNPSGPAVWLLTLLAASVGGWSRVFPARQQLTLFGRAVVLLTGAVLMQVVPGTGGPTGPYFLWLAMIVTFYSLLLWARWTTVLTVLALTGFGLGCWLAQSTTGWQQALPYAGFLALVAPLASVVGQALRQSDEQAEAALRDDRTLLYNEAGFFVHGAVLLAECRKRERPFSMVLLNGGDLRDIPDLLGRKVANDLFKQAVQVIGAIPGEGIAARIDAIEFALLLPGVTPADATELVQQRLGTPPKVELQVNAKPVVIWLDMSVAQPLDNTQSIEELYDKLHANWSTRQAAGPDVRRAPILGPDDARTTGRSRQLGPTVPMPLPAHLRREPDA